MKHSLKADVFSIDSLSDQQKKQMFSLYANYYEGFQNSLFFKDLANKHWAILLFDSKGFIRGFSTLFVSDFKHEGKQIRSVFSGDTIIHHEYWGEQSLPHAWCCLVGKLKAQQPSVPLYWFLIVKGHRTYRYLRIFSKEFYPQYSKSTPKHIQAIIDYLGHEHFGSQYDANTGLIKFKNAHGYLKKEWAGVDKPALKNPDIKYFLKTNPGYQEGDEMVCLTEITEKNMQRFALSAFHEGLNETTQNIRKIDKKLGLASE